MSLRIYHTSDLHDRRGFVPRLRALREERPGLLFDCGDSLRGSQTVYHRNEPVIGEIDAAGYDAQAIGNREFHYLYGLLRARATQMRHPLVCSNLVDTKGRPLPFAPSLVLHTLGVTIHVLGLLIMQYPVGSPFEKVFGWRFLAPWDAVEPYARAIPDGDMLLVLSHVGLSLDRELARRVPRIDLILGGHSHDTLFQPESVDGVPIVHAGPYGQFVSRTELHYDDAARRFAIDDFALVPLLGAR
ncbi:MAG TPA: metallophosphoesterase [Candidatus Baltobacteraceae bacterium]|nr:metallophosphoesterase [Candidatus Baltobacteraceae bacterium]